MTAYKKWSEAEGLDCLPALLVFDGKTLAGNSIGSE